MNSGPVGLSRSKVDEKIPPRGTLWNGDLAERLAQLAKIADSARLRPASGRGQRSFISYVYAFGLDHDDLKRAFQDVLASPADWSDLPGRRLVGGDFVLYHSAATRFARRTFATAWILPASMDALNNSSKLLERHSAGGILSAIEHIPSVPPLAETLDVDLVQVGEVEGLDAVERAQVGREIDFIRDALRDYEGDLELRVPEVAERFVRWLEGNGQLGSVDDAEQHALEQVRAVESILDLLD